MKVATLIILALLTLGVGYWARMRARMTELQADLCTGVLSPIRVHYPSMRTKAQEEEIARREAELKRQLQGEARNWWVFSIGSFFGGIVPLSWIGSLIHSAWRRSRSKID